MARNIKFPTVKEFSKSKLTFDEVIAKNDTTFFKTQCRVVMLQRIKFQYTLAMPAELLLI